MFTVHRFRFDRDVKKSETPKDFRTDTRAADRERRRVLKFRRFILLSVLSIIPRVITIAHTKSRFDDRKQVTDIFTYV